MAETKNKKSNSKNNKTNSVNKNQNKSSKSTIKKNNKKNQKRISKKNKKNKRQLNINRIKNILGIKINFSILDILILIVITAIISTVITGFIMNYQYKKSNVLYETSLIKDEYLNDFIKTYSDIVNNYYEEIDRKEMLASAVSEMLEFLKDNYSIYLDKDQSDSLNNTLDASYQGIGILVSGQTIYKVYKDSPAEKAGLRSEDIIIEVNNEKITKDNYGEISNLIKNNNEEENTIIVKRKDEEITVKVQTDTVIMDTTTSKIIEKEDNKIGYIALSSFSSQSYEQFELELMKLEDEKINSLIIDLRGNGGGYLNTANDIASLFLEKGKVIYYLENKKNKNTFKDKSPDKREYPIVVLVNGATASAAEIVTAALKDSYGATIVGKKTYGKGKVQNLSKYEDSTVKYTSAKWLRPNGECIDEIGITPDYEVENEIKDDKYQDNQLDKAIELIK